MSTEPNEKRPSGKQANAIAYLQRSLKLNPLYASEKIIRYRFQALGLKKSKHSATPAEDPAKRTRLLQQVEAIRSACWTDPVAPLLAKLKQLGLEAHPDLQRTGERLRVILNSRDRLPELVDHKHFDEKFMFCFKQILTLPPRELAVRREQVVASFRNRKKRRKGMNMLKLLETTVPELCQLEQEWLDSLKRQKANRDTVAKVNSYEAETIQESSGMSGWAIGIAFFVIIKVVVAILRNS